MTMATHIAMETATIATESIGAVRVTAIATATNTDTIVTATDTETTVTATDTETTVMATNLAIVETVGIERESRDAKV
ncbi:MAG: hypothetical protein K1563_13230 [Candidatus Thiodiazotropha sp. (ex. Lucinisca nassula)]|nr:hypothetical protein [Candidatus Thiodiazotropha sp. (ex. Lucinisca nassula)]MBW9274642.1 hypothetical protein [Candidatus Thiodiazotropha sp. (ex. Lucinisca nassula)]PUB82809.1 MAG: hypothetical protein DBP02_14230 [gamma proteobacterium symbiont of Ctena orbiculata]PUB90947.1 MAG: hypothetical protein DBP01_04930 [gamma proteobacterium symbiont of Ctena orbiculata]